jgi:site-specific DNA-methyltransferase (adenine-specific)
LNASDLKSLADFFEAWGQEAHRVLVPGAHVFLASNPLVSHIVTSALVCAGFEPRGTVIRLVMTMRGGERPKNAHTEFPDVSVMPRSMWEPWILVRKPVEGRVQDNLRKWGTGGLRRVRAAAPFGDVIRSSPTHKKERQIASHPSLKPQALLRQIVRASLPLGKGVVLDPFAGSGSTLAAAEAIGYRSIGIEKDAAFVETAKGAIPKLRELSV